MAMKRQPQDYDLICRYVPNYGWLPIVLVEGKEFFRGSFQPTAEAALAECQQYLPRILENWGISLDFQTEGD